MNYFMYALGIILYSYCSFELGGPNIFVFAKKSTVDEPLEIYRQMIEANCEDYLNGTSRSDFQVRLTNYFRQVDKNNDSFVTVDECKGWENDNGFKLDDNLAEAWLLQYDFDGNGKISVDEFASTKIDANDDSILTMEECIQYDFEKMLNAVNALKNANTTTETRNVRDCTIQIGGPSIYVFAKEIAVDEPLERYIKMIEANCEEFLNGTSLRDFEVRLTDYFRKVDKNNDSFVTVDESIGFENDNAFTLDDTLAEVWLIQYDSDGNGKISVDEFASTKIDANNDSILTMEECIQYEIGKLHNALDALKNANSTSEK